MDGSLKWDINACALVEAEMQKGVDFNSVRRAVAKHLKDHKCFLLGVERLESKSVVSVVVTYWNQHNQTKVVRFLEDPQLTKRYGSADHW